MRRRSVAISIILLYQLTGVWCSCRETGPLTVCPPLPALLCLLSLLDLSERLLRLLMLDLDLCAVAGGERDCVGGEGEMRWGEGGVIPPARRQSAQPPVSSLSAQLDERLQTSTPALSQPVTPYSSFRNTKKPVRDGPTHWLNPFPGREKISRGKWENNWVLSGVKVKLRDRGSGSRKFSKVQGLEVGCSI